MRFRQGDWIIGAVVVLLTAQTLASDFSPDSDAGRDVQKAFLVFKQENPAYEHYELIISSDRSSMVADKGDADGDGYDEVIFGIRDTQVPEHTSAYEIPKRLIILKLLGENGFKTLLNNQAIAEHGYDFEVSVDEGGGFGVMIITGGYAHQPGPGAWKTIGFGLSENGGLPIRSLSYRSPWRTESASPENSYSYDFDTMLYSEAWDVYHRSDLSLDDFGGRSEEGILKFKPGIQAIYLDDETDIQAIYLDDNTDVSEGNGKIPVTPAIVYDATTRTPDPEKSYYGPE